MLVPAMIYGFYPEVERRIKRMVKAICNGTSFEEALCSRGLIDTNDHAGLLLLKDADRFLGDREHFHIVYPLAMVLGPLLEGKLTDDDEDTVFTSCLQSAWGVLLLLPHSLATWVDPPRRWIPFLRAAAQHWPLFEAQGARYSYGLPYGHLFHEQITTVDYILLNAGIIPPLGPHDPLPPNWPDLVEAYAARHSPILQ